MIHYCTTALPALDVQLYYNATISRHADGCDMPCRQVIDRSAAGMPAYAPHLCRCLHLRLPAAGTMMPPACQ